MKLRIHSQLLRQLGQELITDEFIALTELIKNSYDADAKYCNVTIDTKGHPPAYSQYKDSRGYIIIEDDGFGMDKDDLQNQWLYISYSAKRAPGGGKKEKTPDDRTPLGDKGLGRISSQRLGERIEIFSMKEKSPAAGLALDWTAFEKDLDITKVDIETERATKKAKAIMKAPGTTILISQLSFTEEDPLVWERRLASKMSKLMSPFETILGFRPKITVNENRIALNKVTREIREKAPLEYHLDFDGETLSMKGNFRVAYLRPKKDLEPYFREYIQDDDGEAFFQRLREKASGKDGKIERQSNPWLAEFKRSKKVQEIEHEVDLTRATSGCGPFSGTIHYFDINYADELDPTKYGSKANLQTILQELAGIRVYRDGFEVGVDRDWLDMSESARKGSYYDLRPSNTIGFIRIKAETNPNLIDATDREGLVDNEANRLFKALLKEFVEFTGHWQRWIRRQVLEYLLEQRSLHVHINPDHTAASLAQEIRNDLKVISGRKSKQTPQKATEQLLEKMSILEGKIDGLSDKMTDLFRLAGIGLTAATLFHEIEGVTTSMRASSKDALEEIRKKKPSVELIEQRLLDVESVASTLQKQVGLLIPSVRYVRETKNTFQLEDEIQKIVDRWTPLLEEDDIVLILKIKEGAFNAKMPIGRLHQVMNNLIQNSRFWCKETNPPHLISVMISRGIVTLHDSGPGVKPDVEDSLFDAGSTRRPGGSGLGLYVSKNLMDGIDCTLQLLPDRREGRRYKFELDLTPARAPDE